MEKYIEDRVEMWRSSILDAFDKVKYNDIVDRTGVGRGGQVTSARG